MEIGKQIEVCARWNSVGIWRIRTKCLNLCWKASFQSPVQLHTKCGDNAIPAILSSNITLEVILRNYFVETSMKFAFLKRDDAW